GFGRETSAPPLPAGLLLEEPEAESGTLLSALNKPFQRALIEGFTAIFQSLLKHSRIKCNYLMIDKGRPTQLYRSWTASLPVTQFRRSVSTTSTRTEYP